MTNLLPATAEGVAAAAAILDKGGLVCFPTDTVYGVGCLAEIAAARDRFYAAKARNPQQPAIVMAATQAALEPWVEVDDVAGAMMADHWPGPLTLVLRATPVAVTRLGPVVMEGSLAVRIPAHATAMALLEAVGRPLATSSANVVGAPAPRTASEAIASIGERVDAVLAGECPLGVASSILDLTGARPRVIREGAIPAARLLS